MSFVASRPRRKIYYSSKLNTEYGHSLQMYSVPPNETISLQEFEEFALERLKGTPVAPVFILGPIAKLFCAPSVKNHRAYQSGQERQVLGRLASGPETGPEETGLVHLPPAQLQNP